MPKKESTNWSFKLCALSGSIEGSDDDKIMCIRCGSCKDLLECLTSLEDTGVDPFEEFPEHEASLEGVPELAMDSDNSDEDEGAVLNGYFMYYFVYNFVYSTMRFSVVPS